MKNIDRNDLLFQISKREFLVAAKIPTEDEPKFYSLLSQRFHVNNQLRKMLCTKKQHLSSLLKAAQKDSI